MATKTATTKGFAHRCPACGTEDSLRIDLSDVQNSLTCGDCEASFTVEDVREIAKGWAKIVAWLETAPERE